MLILKNFLEIFKALNFIF